MPTAYNADILECLKNKFVRKDNMCISSSKLKQNNPVKLLVWIESTHEWAATALYKINIILWLYRYMLLEDV